MLSRKVFAGGGIRRTYIGAWGPWAVPFGVAASALLAPWIAARLVAGNSTRTVRWAIVAAAALLSLATIVLTAHAPNGMPYFHVLLLAVGLALAFQSLELLRLPPPARHAAVGLSLLCLPSLLALPSPRPVGALMTQYTWAGLQLIDYAQFHLDRDRDGYARIFGGGDCDDSDPTVFTGAIERPGDGRDSDCDGLDDPKSSGLSFEPFRTRDDGLARQISERARQFPTVVILVDALRFDRVGSPRFPNLAQLTRESIRFTRVYATAATTLTSVPAMMSGRVFPSRAHDNIAQALARAGRSSSFIAPDVVTKRFQTLGSQDPIASFSASESVPTGEPTAWGAGETVSTSKQLTRAALEQLDSARPPSLLWLHYYDLHQWYALEDERLPDSDDVARYDAVLEHLDADLGPLLAKRDQLNVVLLADHGEALGARGLRAHGLFVFRELTHIPLMVRVPGSKPATVDVPVTSPGAFNMLRALLGLEPDASADQSLLALVGATDVGNGPGLASFDNAQWSLLYGKYRLLYTPRRQLLELYDVRQDPSETNNLTDENPQLTRDLLARLFQIHNAQSP
ncbi:MAG TPA: sulfatase-like hydrolase/transferase [Polyangiaceae bacterium]|nr:sulfatase-like hydrolase/transferase [Polyangiaceae bacterium]